MKETFQLVEMGEKPSKSGKPYNFLRIRHTVVNDQGVVVELKEGISFPKKGVIYEVGKNVQPVLNITRSKNGFLEVAELDFMPIEDPAEEVQQ